MAKSNEFVVPAQDLTVFGCPFIDESRPDCAPGCALHHYGDAPSHCKVVKLPDGKGWKGTKNCPLFRGDVTVRLTQ